MMQNLIPKEQFEEFKQYVKSETLPLTGKFSLKDRDYFRNQIRYAKDEQELQQRIIQLNQRYKLSVDLEHFQAAFSTPSLLEQIKAEHQDTFRICFTSGLLQDGIFFQTFFLKHHGSYHPFVVTSNNELIEVKHHENEVRAAGRKPGEEEKYSYFEYHGITYKFITELFFRDTFNINTVNNDVLWILEQEQYSKNIYEKLIQKIKEYWDHSNQYEFEIIAAFILQTPILWLLGKTFYLVPQGIIDTGKSTLQKVISRLQFNGRFSGKGTIPVTVRLIHCLGIHHNQDEVDKLGKEEKTTFMGVLNSGLYADGTYTITNVNKRAIKDQITDLYTFSAKSFSANSLGLFDSSFLSRVYVLTCTRQRRTLKDIHTLSDKEDREFQQLRNELFAYCVVHALEIKQDIQDVKQELEAEGIFGRKTDIHSIILGVVKHFKGQYYLQVKEHLREKEGLQVEERKDTTEGILFAFFQRRFAEGGTALTVSNKELLLLIYEALGVSVEDARKDFRLPKAKTVNTLLKNYGLLKSPANITRKSSGMVYTIFKADFLDMVERFGYTELMQNPPAYSTYASYPSSNDVENVENEENEAGLPFKVTEEKVVQQQEEILSPRQLVLECIKVQPENNAALIQKECPKAVQALLDEGVIVEEPKGTYRIVA